MTGEGPVRWTLWARWARWARRTGRLSLRARLLLIGGALLTVGLVASMAVAIGFLNTHLLGRVDNQMRLVVAIFARLGPAEAPNSTVDVTPQQPNSGLDLIRELYIAYVTPDGSPIGAVRPTGSPDVGQPVLPSLGEAEVAARGGRPFEVPGTGTAEHWRVIALPRLAAPNTAAAIAGGDLTHRVPDLAPPGTEVGRLSAALNGMLAQLETAFAARAESEARMRRFVGDAGHELRTPLFGIKGFTELYRMGGLSTPDDVDRTMSRIEAESGRLARLAEDLLLLARLDEQPDALPLHLAPMDLRTLAADARNDLRALDPSRSITLTGPGPAAGGHRARLGPPAPAPVHGDEARLRQVVSNLVGNAIAHTPAGTQVRIGVGTVGPDSVLEISDTGPGLTQEQAARVFERFYRADGSRSRSAGGGAGLGLAIVWSLTSAHGGTVELATEPGRGATFRIRIPSTVDSDGDGPDG